jgi:hypothetical protein
MRPLTATMKLALDSIEQEPGTPAHKLPGGTRTVKALMARLLVEVEGSDWKTYLPPHKHEFVRSMHLDGCHHFSSTYTCKCGAVARSYNERSIAFDGWSSVWMMNDDGEPMCPRCEALLQGAKPQSEFVIGHAPEIDAGALV